MSLNGSSTAQQVAELNRIRYEQVKQDAYRHCYPMIKCTNDPLYYQTWSTFSYIWDMAINSVETK